MFFEEPQPFDLVMLLTGAGAVPYLREGPIVTPQHWARSRKPSSNFFAYPFWFIEPDDATHSASVSV